VAEVWEPISVLARPVRAAALLDGSQPDGILFQKKKLKNLVGKTSGSTPLWWPSSAPRWVLFAAWHWRIDSVTYVTAGPQANPWPRFKGPAKCDRSATRSDMPQWQWSRCLPCVLLPLLHSPNGSVPGTRIILLSVQPVPHQELTFF